MVRQVGEPVFEDEGEERMIRGRDCASSGSARTDRGVKKVIRYLHETYGNRIYISILNQYTPMPGMENIRSLTGS